MRRLLREKGPILSSTRGPQMYGGSQKALRRYKQNDTLRSHIPYRAYLRIRHSRPDMRAPDQPGRSYPHVSPRLVQDEQRSEQDHMQQLQQQHHQLQHGAGGAFTRVIQQGPVTYTFTYGGGGGGGGGGEISPDIDALLGLPGTDGIGGIDFANLHVRPPCPTLKSKGSTAVGLWKGSGPLPS